MGLIRGTERGKTYGKPTENLWKMMENLLKTIENLWKTMENH